MKIKKMMYLLPLGAMFAGCADNAFNDDATMGNCTIVAGIDNNGDENGEEVKARTCVDPTKYADGVVGLLWTPGDALGVYGTNGTKNAMFTTTDKRSGRASFSGTLALGETPQYAYYPYSADNATRAVDALRGSVSAEQSFTLSSGLLTDDWKVGTLKGSTGAGYEFTMKHLFSMIRVTVNAGGSDLEGENLEYLNVEVVAADARTPRINGSFTFSAVDGTYKLDDVAAEGSNAIRMTWPDKPTMSANATYEGYLTAIPDIKTGDKLRISVATADYVMTYEVKSKLDFKAGYIYDFPMSLTYLAEKMKEDYGTEPQKTSLPKMTALEFTVANNPGKILDKKLETSHKLNALSASYDCKFNAVTTEQATITGNNIELLVPYLYNYNLVPTFSVPEGAVVTVDGTEVVSGKTEVNWSAVKELVVSANGNSRTYNVNIHNNGLPVVVIDQSESGDFSDSKDDSYLVNKFVDFKIRGKETEWVNDDKIWIYDADGTVSVDGAAGGIRQRGNSTRKLPKKAMNIKFDKKQQVLDMPKHKRWCLLANWIDRSMMRNLLGFAVADATIEAVGAGALEPGLTWNPRGRSVELVIEGRHVGNYLLCEQIKIDGKRLDINDCYEDLVKDGKSSAFEDCGFLIEGETRLDEAYNMTTKRGVALMLKDDANTLPADYWTKFQNKIQDIEDRITANNYADFSQVIDIPSVIDQWIVWELALNREYTEPHSVYMYMNGGGDKLHAGPVWDFDRATFQNPENAKAYGSSTSDYRVKPWDKFLSDNLSPSMWYPLLMKNAEYKAEVKKRWAVIYPVLKNMEGKIRQIAAENAASWETNNKLWPNEYSALKAGYPGYPWSKFSDFAGDEKLTTYNDVIDNLVYCYNGRLEAMNTLINNLQ